MGKSGSSTTTQQPQIPAWLTRILQPYLKGSVGRASMMQDQGNQVLQGGDYKTATPYVQPKAAPGGGKLDPEMLAAYYAQRGGNA